jgi:hypothetical protein
MSGANISEAFRRVTERPWLLAALVLTNIGLSVLLAAPLSAMLSVLLDRRPAATGMVGGDMGLIFELIIDHPEVVVAAGTAAAAGLMLYGLLSWVLGGGMLAALALDGERRARGAAEVLAASARLAGRMIVTGLFGMTLRSIPLLFGALAYFIAHSVITGRTFQPNMMTSMLSLLVAAIAWTTVSIAVDYARGLALDDTETWSWRLIGRGLQMLWTRRSATLQLVAFGLAAWLAVGLGYFFLASHVTAPFILTLLRLVAVVGRVAITMTTMTAAARVARA